MLTHANLSSATAQYVETTHTQPQLLDEGRERILAVLPPFHIYALTVNMLMGMRIGAELILHTRFDTAAVVKDICEKKVTVFPGVPTMYVAIINHPGVENLDLSSIKWCASGGAPLPLEVQKRFQDISGCRLAEGWGMTETSPTGTFTPLEGAVKPGSCGIPIPGITIKFADVDDPSRYVGVGEKGEICIGGPNVMKGYWKRADATKETMTKDGFLRTGDVGYMDEDGYVFIVDRTKDMLLCGGFNVYPRIIEEAIYQHPGIEEVIVVGIHDDYRGQSPKAFVKLKANSGAVTLEQMKDFLKGQVGKARNDQCVGNSRCPAQDCRRQAVQEGTLRRGSAKTRCSKMKLKSSGVLKVARDHARLCIAINAPPSFSKPSLLEAKPSGMPALPGGPWMKA